jgi:hypothetical protein
MSSCGCGCGASITPGRQFRPGHNLAAAARGRAIPVWDRMLPRIDFAVCWEWTGARDPSGFGVVWAGPGGDNVRVHRLVWEILVGPIDLKLDHMCRNRLCCNPDHLTPVVSISRRYAATGFGPASECARGHLFTEANTLVRKRSNGATFRHCRECARIRERSAYRAAIRVAAPSNPSPIRPPHDVNHP